ncbi:MAG TPA: nicotinate phosphoribosyltransferase [Clostridia bacterium]|nr:nicotinate phosphoribosyltransferase [Clostridia bacterium]
MALKQLRNLEEVAAYKPASNRKFLSAEHDEIMSGLTTDIYFVRTSQLLNRVKKADTPVVAEVFARRQGIFAGTQEVINLFQGRKVELWSLPEGTQFEGKEVVMRIEGPYEEFGIYETVLLGILASSSGWATAANEAKRAAGDKPVLCFGARHVHPAVAPVMERCAIIGGADGASCILGAKLAGMEPAGTVPHAFFLIMGDTVEGATLYNEFMPPDASRVIIADTFNDEAIETLRLAEALGDDLEGVRLDTPSERGGVTPELIKEVKYRLEKSGFNHVKIFVSGGLTPERIAVLTEAGADAFGVGSYISGAKPIDMTMDLKVIDGKPLAKRGRLPGIIENPKLEKLL